MRLITGVAVIYGLSWLMVVFSRNILYAIFLSWIGVLILVMVAFGVDGIRSTESSEFISNCIDKA